MMKEKNTQKTQDLKFLDLMLLVFEKFGGKTPRNTKLKNFKIKTQGNSRTLWRLTRTQEHEGRTPNLKIFWKPKKNFENQREINKKTPNLKFGTRFNQRKIIFEKILKRRYPITKNINQHSSQLSYKFNVF